MFPSHCSGNGSLRDLRVLQSSTHKVKIQVDTNPIIPQKKKTTFPLTSQKLATVMEMIWKISEFD